MAYCTQEDIEKLIPEQELAELTTESGSDIDADVVTEAIAKADTGIDSYLGVRYLVPFSLAPAVIRFLSVDLAIYHLYTRRSIAPGIRRTRYEDALKFLQELADGTAVIPGAVEREAPADPFELTDNARGRIFSRRALENY
ncbi:gp436 family protein [Desulfobacca acetoxidans]